MQIDFFNPRSIICFIAILQGLIFAVLLVNRGFQRKNKADFWLALLLILLCSTLITPFIGFANVYDLNQWLTYFPFSIAYSYGICVWFYTLNLTDSKRRPKIKDLFFFAPTLIYLAFRFYIFAQPLEWKDWFDKNYYVPFVVTFVFVTEFIWNLVFLYFSIKHYKRYRMWLNENFSDTERVKFDWLRNFLYIFTSVLIIGAIFDFTNSFLFKLSYIQFFYFEIILALTTYYLAVAGYLRSQTIELSFTEEQSGEVEQRKTLLAENELEKLKNSLREAMTKEKIYLEPNLALNDVSRKLGVNSAALSYAINSGFGKNFNDFINEYRISDVKEKLESTDGATVLNIAFDCGFNSKATFNRAFKKFTGVSPKEFQANLSNR